MVGQISHLAGQELAQIARQKRGPFQRSHAAAQPRADKDAAATSGVQSSAAPHHHKSAAVTASLKPELPRNYNIEVPVSVATLIADPVSKQNAAQAGSAKISIGHPADGSGLLVLQDVARQDEQTSAPTARNSNGQGNGLALGHDKGPGGKPAIEKPDQAPEPISLDRPRPTDDNDPANFIKRYQHRDFNAEAALNLLSDGKEQARDASLAVKFQAYADSATAKSQDQHFVQQFLDGAEKV